MHSRNDVGAADGPTAVMAAASGAYAARTGGSPSALRAASSVDSVGVSPPPARSPSKAARPSMHVTVVPEALHFARVPLVRLPDATCALLRLVFFRESSCFFSLTISPHEVSLILGSRDLAALRANFAGARRANAPAAAAAAAWARPAGGAELLYLFIFVWGGARGPTLRVACVCAHVRLGGGARVVDHGRSRAFCLLLDVEVRVAPHACVRAPHCPFARFFFRCGG